MESIKILKKHANQLRQDIIEISYKANGPSHPAPALSCADIVAALYFDVMDIDPLNPQWEERDRLILSKGHACPVIYSALAEKGFFPKDWLWTIRHLNSRLQGHPDMRKTPGIDMTTGSLGNGLSIGLGMAVYLKHLKRDSKVFVILGDGEIQEGPVWEAAMSAPVLHVDNLIAIVDNNKFQSCDSCEKILPMPEIRNLWKDNGWHVIEINGHDMHEIISALHEARKCKEKPSCIIAHTVKGRGVSFMENDNSWHQKTPTEGQFLQAMDELKEEASWL